MLAGDRAGVILSLFRDGLNQGLMLVQSIIPSIAYQESRAWLVNQVHRETVEEILEDAVMFGGTHSRMKLEVATDTAGVIGDFELSVPFNGLPVVTRQPFGDCGLPVRLPPRA